VASYDQFVNRSDNNAKSNRDVATHVIMSNKIYDGVPVAKWNGQSIMDDWFWDKNIIGHLIFVNNEYVLKPTGL
jgi:hypothetical protein